MIRKCVKKLWNNKKKTNAKRGKTSFSLNIEKTMRGSWQKMFFTTKMNAKQIEQHPNLQISKKKGKRRVAQKNGFTKN